tara:strand:+ start:41 stop:619 length:579 start_codon:yes stop_codon:yes gene_type:complete
MTEDKSNITVDKIVAHAYLNVGMSEVKKDPRNVKYAMGALENYLKGVSDEVAEAVSPWIAGLPQAIKANNGILPVMAEEAFKVYDQTSTDQLLEAKVATIVDAAKKVGYGQEIPEFVSEYEGTFKDLVEKTKELEGKDEKDLTEEEKKLVYTSAIVDELRDRMYAHSKVSMDDDFSNRKLKAIEENLKPKED